MLPFSIDEAPPVAERVCHQMIESYYDIDETMVFRDWYKWQTTAINVYRLKEQYSPV